MAVIDRMPGRWQRLLSMEWAIGTTVPGSSKDWGPADRLDGRWIGRGAKEYALADAGPVRRAQKSGSTVDGPGYLGEWSMRRKLPDTGSAKGRATTDRRYSG